MAKRLDRLNPSNSSGIAFQKLWQRNCELIEGQFTDLAVQLAAITAAQAAATAAQATATAVQKSDKLTSSSVLPANVLSATDAGANATITIANHARLYGDGTSIAVVTGGSLTGLAYSTYYGVYYDDTTLAATAPTYHATTTPSNALNNFTTGRHFVGNVTTPAAAGAPTTGGASPPGTDPGERFHYSNL